jgi:hypothetical protein
MAVTLAREVGFKPGTILRIGELRKLGIRAGWRSDGGASAH